MHKAYRKTAKAWHPDRFREEQAKLDAEERFKRIQVAFRELVEHNPEGWSAPAAGPADTEEKTVAPRVVEPKLEFGGARGCYAGAAIPFRVVERIADLIGTQGFALGLVDLSRRGDAEFSEFLIVATHGLMYRDALQIVSLVSYADIGEMRLVDRREDARTGWWQRMIWMLADSGPRFALEILRRDGSVFCALESPTEDRVKTGLYRFIEAKRRQMPRD